MLIPCISPAQRYYLRAQEAHTDLVLKPMNGDSCRWLALEVVVCLPRIERGDPSEYYSLLTVIDLDHRAEGLPEDVGLSCLVKDISMSF